LRLGDPGSDGGLNFRKGLGKEGSDFGDRRFDLLGMPAIHHCVFLAVQAPQQIKGGMVRRLTQSQGFIQPGAEVGEGLELLCSVIGRAIGSEKPIENRHERHDDEGQPGYRA
jgi:hypothetical protein